jgi:hypothetical protein
MALLKLVQSLSLAPPVNTGGGMRVADGMVEFPVATIITLPVPVPDAGAVTMVIVVLVAFSIGAVVEIIVTLELYVGVEVDEVEVNVEVKDEFDETIPLQNPFTHVLKAHCESLVHVAWEFPHLGMSIELTA